MDSTLYQRVFILATIVVLGIAAYRIFEPFFGALAWGAALAFILSPTHDWLTRRLKGKNGVAAGIITGLTPLVLLAPLALLGVAFAQQVRQLIEKLQKSSFRLDGSLLYSLERVPLVGRAANWVRDTINVSAAQLEEWVVGGVQTLLRNLAAASGNIVLGAVGTLIGFFLMLFLLFFLLRDGQAMLQRAVRLVPVAEERRTQLLKLIANTTRAVIYGSGVTALVQGVLVGIAFAIAGLPAPIVFAVFTTIAALLPTGGSGIVWIPATIYLAAVGRWGWAIFMLIWGIGVSTSDNILRPMLVSSRAPVSTLAVFIGVIGGVSAFGTIGLIAGPVLLTLIVALLRFVDDLARKDTPSGPA